MMKGNKLKMYSGLILLALIMLMNLYRALTFYNLKGAKLSTFFLSQTAIKSSR